MSSDVREANNGQPTTDHGLASLERAKLDMVRPWIARARAVIAGRIKDARAHAERGDLLTARSRIAAMVKDIAGTLKTPETGIEGQARAAFYRDSFSLQRRRLDPEIHNLDLAPGDEDTLAVQRHHYGGSPFYLAMQDRAETALRSMAIATAVIKPGDSGNVKKAVWDQWERNHTEQTQKRVERELKTVSIAIYETVGRLMLKPEYR